MIDDANQEFLLFFDFTGFVLIEDFSEILSILYDRTTSRISRKLVL